MSRSNFIASLSVPYLPPQVNAAVLHKENGKLLNNADIRGLEEKLSAMPDARYHKSGLGSPYGIIKYNNQLYAIYRDVQNNLQVELGVGALGKVKLAQNLVTGKWYVLKTSVLTDEHLTNVYLSESQVLQYLKLSPDGKVEALERESKRPGVRKGNILMEYVPGDGLDKFYLETRYCEKIYPNLLWFKIINEILTALLNLHERELLHCDLKLQNVMVCLEDMTANLIDFGFSQYHSGEEKLAISENRGTRGYRAPEIEQQILLEQDLVYSEKSDVYAMGTLAKELLTKWYSGDDKYYRCSKNKEKHHHPTPPFDEDKVLKNFIDDQMRAVDPRQRPTLQQAINFFRKKEEDYILSHPSELKELELLQKETQTATINRLAQAFKKS